MMSHIDVFLIDLKVARTNTKKKRQHSVTFFKFFGIVEQANLNDLYFLHLMPQRNCAFGENPCWK